MVPGDLYLLQDWWCLGLCGCVCVWVWVCVNKVSTVGKLQGSSSGLSYS